MGATQSDLGISAFKNTPYTAHLVVEALSLHELSVTINLLHVPIL